MEFTHFAEIQQNLIHSIEQDSRSNTEHCLSSAITYINHQPKLFDDEHYATTLNECRTIQETLPQNWTHLQCRVDDLWRHVILSRQAQSGNSLRRTLEAISDNHLSPEWKERFFYNSHNAFIIADDAMLIHEKTLKDFRGQSAADFWRDLKDLLDRYPLVKELKIVGSTSHKQALERPLLEKLLPDCGTIEPASLVKNRPLTFLSKEALKEIAPQMTCLDLTGIDLPEKDIEELIHSSKRLQRLYICGDRRQRVNKTPTALKIPATLTDLDCSGCRNLKRLDLQEAKELQSLVCWNCPLESLDIQNYRSLRKLHFEACSLKHLDLSGCCQLQEVYCKWSPKLESVDLTGCAELRKFICWDSSVKSLNLQDCPKLKELDCGQCKKLESLNLEKCAQLEDLICNESRIKHLDLQECGNLRYLDCDDSPELIDVKFNSASRLESINCQSCPQLATLNLSGSSQLRSVICERCDVLVNLNVARCTQLQKIRCYGCDELQEVDLTGCSSLKKFRGPACKQLTNLNFQDCLSLELLDCIDCDSLQSLGPSLPNCRALWCIHCPCLTELPLLPSDAIVYSSSPESFSHFRVDLNNLQSQPLAVLLELGRNYLLKNKPFPEITFTGSPGIDAGGLRRHFVTTLFRHLVNCPELFTGEEGQRLPVADSEDKKEAFLTVGRLFSVCLNRYAPNLRTGPLFHENLFYALRWISQHIDFQNVSVQDKVQIFAVLKGWRENMGPLPQYVKNSEITEESLAREPTVQAVLWITEAMINHSLREKLLLEESVPAFRRGIEGEKVTWESLQNKLEWISDSPTQMQSFLERWAQENPEKLEDLVLFGTGNRSLSGENLKIEIYSQRDRNQLPVSHTCAFTIDMPIYPDYETFTQKLETALTSKDGFQVA